MKRHLTDGELRASLDGELDEDLLRHVGACAECQIHLQQVKQAHLRIVDQLSFLIPGTESVPSARTAWSRFTRKYFNQKETFMFKKFFVSFPVRVGAVAILALVLLMAFPSTRALAGELLNLFRVQQVAVLPIDLAGLENMTGNETLASRLSELISDSTVVTDEPGEPVIVTNAEEASASAGFTVRLPADPTPATIHVTGSTAFTLTVNREKAQSLLEGAGRTDLVLPTEIDGAEVTVNVPASVNAAFGTCPEPQMNRPGPNAPRGSHPDCIVFAQMPSPVVNVPASVDMAQLARIGLEFTGMSREEAEAFTASVDWTTTLVVPIPRNAATYADVSVDGVSGKLIQRTSEYSPEYALLWVKDGIIYIISGFGTDTTSAFAIAESLP